MIANKTASAAGVTCRGADRLVVRPFNPLSSTKRSVVMRFRDDDKASAAQQTRPTDPKISPKQVDEVLWKPDGELSPRTAEMRADLGTAVQKDLHMAQAFDGPAPETINSRLAMLGVLTGLVGEVLTGKGLLEQTADHPVTVFASFVIISIASYVPIYKGYTRKEPFANGFLGLPWTPQAENWNGRLAMMGFAGMVLTEFLAGCNTLQAYGLQPHNFGH